MTTKDRILFAQYGQHSAVDPSTFGSVPGSLKFIQPEGRVLPIADYEYDEHDLQTATGERIPSTQGARLLDVPDITMELRGLSGAGAGDGVSTLSLAHDAAELLESLVGATAADATGDLLDAADAGSGTTLKVNSGTTTLAADDAVLFATDAGVANARVVTSISGDPSLTLDRAPTDIFGVATTPTESATAYGARRYSVTPANVDSLHNFLRLEGMDSRRDYFGVLGTGKIMLPPRGLAKLALTGQRCMTWSDPPEESPTYAAATRGSILQNLASMLNIDGVLYQAFGFELDFGVDVQPRTADGGDDGTFGSAVGGRFPTMTFKLRTGTLTTPTEVTDAQLATWRGDATVDLSLQIGSAVGKCLLLRARAARLKAERESDNGQVVLGVTAQCDGPNPLDLYLF